MNSFVVSNTNMVKGLSNQYQMTRLFDRTKPYYEKSKKTTARKPKAETAAADAK